MPGSLRIFRIAGIDIYINVSWVIILVFLTYALATGEFPAFFPGYSSSTYFLLGFISALLLFVSVLLHELAHSLVARARGLAVNSIVLFIFGGVSNIEQEPQTPGVEFSMAFVGPLTSLVIGAICYGLFLDYCLSLYHLGRLAIFYRQLAERHLDRFYWLVSAERSTVGQLSRDVTIYAPRSDGRPGHG